MRPPRDGLLGTLAVLACLGAAGLWLADALGRGAPPAVSRLTVLLAAATLGFLGTRWLARLWRQDRGVRLLLALVLLSLVLCFVGLDHEVGGRAFADEGTYRAQAERINQEGQLLRPWFVYPHLLFYLNALALWVAGLFQPAVDGLARLVYGVEGEIAFSVLVTRSVTATLGALVPVPVFVAARRVAGLPAAVAAGALAALSPQVVEIAHQNLSDVAAASFAALALMQATALLDGERTRDYVLAGVWAGLAAGSKYPAGVVVVAIVALWLRWRVRERRPTWSAAWKGWGLLWAGLASLAAFLATTPSLLAFPQEALTGNTGLLFGARLYAEHGWAGVVRSSNTLYYAGQVVANYGLPAVILGLAGLAGLRRRQLTRLAWLLPFPAVHLGLLASLEMAMERNLLPILPVCAVVLGSGLAGVWRGLGRTRLPGRLGMSTAALLVTAALAVPAFATGTTVVRLARQTTREQAAAWIAHNLPPGSFLVQEAYTPRLAPEWRFPARHPRFAIRLSRDELEDGTYDFLFLSAGSYNRFLRHADDPARAVQAERYRELFERYEPVRRWTPGRFRGGPELRLQRLDPQPPPWTDRRAFTPGEALLRSPEMAPRPEGGPVRYTAPDQWSLVKAYLLPGTYRVRLATGATAGRIEVRDRTNRVVAEGALAGRPMVEIELPERAKYFVYAELPPGSELRGVTLRRLPATPAPEAATGRG